MYHRNIIPSTGRLKLWGIHAILKGTILYDESGNLPDIVWIDILLHMSTNYHYVFAHYFRSLLVQEVCFWDYHIIIHSLEGIAISIKIWKDMQRMPLFHDLYQIRLHCCLDNMEYIPSGGILEDKIPAGRGLRSAYSRYLQFLNNGLASMGLLNCARWLNQTP